MPSFNAEKWIKSAIENVINQTYKEWELIIIDDGSVDNTYEICYKKKKKDKRIKVYRQKNGGPSSARNRGLKEIKGDYFLFIDCDDFLPPNALEIYAGKANKFGADVIVAGYTVKRIADSKVTRYCADREIYYEIVDHNINTEETEYLIKKGLMASNWNKLYKNHLSRIEFNESISINEDVLFSISALKKAKRVEIIPHILYEYKIYNGESVSKRFHPELLNALMLIENQLIYRNEKLRPLIIEWLMNYMFIQLKLLCSNDRILRDKVKYIKYVKKHMFFEKYGKILNVQSVKRKLGITLIKCHCYRLFVSVINGGR